MAEIRIGRKLLAGFRRRALRSYPVEHVEYLAGKRRRYGLEVLALYPVEHEASCSHISIDQEEIDELHAQAEAAGLILLGSAHSHPDCQVQDCSPSETDWRHLFDEKRESVVGILTIQKTANNRRKTRVVFYHSKHPFTIKQL